ncbi:MAG: NAD(+) diphosphatase, partial [Spirochaetaceae bacterium]|nr:NAD(+) diphosphatase [Spirochaetaceae bacterium]
MIFKDSELLVKAESSFELAEETVLQKCFEQNYAKDWFSEPEKNYTTAILDEGAPTPAKHKWIRLRELFANNNPVAPAAARALALLKWRKTARFCGCCGG